MGKRFRRFSLALAGFAMALGVGVAIGTSAGRTPMETRAIASTTGIFNKITTVDGIDVGDQVIFVNALGNRALSSLNAGNYGDVVEVSAVNDQLILDDTNIEEFVVESGKDGVGFSFQGTVNFDGYLNWASGDTLTQSDTKSENCSWTISADNGTLTISNMKKPERLMRMTTGRMACYTSSAGTLAQIYKRASVTSVSRIVATVTAKPNSLENPQAWNVSNVVVAGTLNGCEESDITDYVDITPTRGVPYEEHASYTVSFSVTRKTGVLGNDPLGSVSVDDAIVSENEFPEYSLVSDVSQVNEETLYALGNADKTEFATGGVTSKAIPTSTTNSGIGHFRLERNGNGYAFRFVTGFKAPYTLGKYLSNSDADLSEVASAPTIWTPTLSDGKVYLGIYNSNRFLGDSKSHTVKAYATNSNPKYYLYSINTDILTGIETVSQKTDFDVNEGFSLGSRGSVTATYSKTGTVGHTGITALADKFKRIGTSKFGTTPTTFSALDNGGTIELTYTDSWGSKATTTYSISVGDDTLAGDLTWGNRGTVDCMAGTTIGDALKYTDWTFDGTYTSGHAFDASWKDVGTGTNQIHLGLYDTADPASEGTPLGLDYEFQEEDNGKYLVAYFLGSKSTSNEAVTITPRLNAISTASYGVATVNLVGNANVLEEGEAGADPVTSARAERYGFSVSATNGFYGASTWKVYAGATFSIEATSGKTISSIQLTFDGFNDGGMGAEYTGINATSWSVEDLGSAAYITSILITYLENDYANVNLEAQKAVIEFAQTVNTQMNAEGVCSTGGVYGINDFALMASAWNVIATKYNDLFGTGVGHLTGDVLVAAQNMLGKATAKWDDTPDCLQRALKTYDFVVANYSSDLADAGVTTVAFMSSIRNVNSAARVNSMSYAGETMNPALLVVILAGLSAAVVGVYFFLKRRQERE